MCYFFYFVGFNLSIVNGGRRSASNCPSCIVGEKTRSNVWAVLSVDSKVTALRVSTRNSRNKAVIHLLSAVHWSLVRPLLHLCVNVFTIFWQKVRERPPSTVRGYDDHHYWRGILSLNMYAAGELGSRALNEISWNFLQYLKKLFYTKESIKKLY